MTKTKSEARLVVPFLFLMFAYFSALCAARPAVPVRTQAVSGAQATPDGPEMLLAKPYRRRKREPSAPDEPCSCALPASGSEWTDSGALTEKRDNNIDIGPSTSSDANAGDNDASREPARVDNGQVQTGKNNAPRVLRPLPLVLNSAPVPRRMRLSMERARRQMECSCYPNDAAWSAQGRSEGMTRDPHARRTRLHVVCMPDGKCGPRDVSVPAPRSKQEEWKSKLSAKY